jgi:hypothetical protein
LKRNKKSTRPDPAAQKDRLDGEDSPHQQGLIGLQHVQNDEKQSKNDDGPYRTEGREGNFFPNFGRKFSFMSLPSDKKKTDFQIG